MFIEFSDLVATGSEAELLSRFGCVTLGILLLIKGKSLLRLSVLTLLFVSGVMTGGLVLRHFAQDGWLPTGPWGLLVLSVLAGCLVAATSRFPFVARWTEVIVTAVLALWLFPLLREYFRPEVTWTIVALLIVASIFSQTVLIGAVAAIAFGLAIGPAVWTPGLLLVICAVCLLTSWFRFGRLPAEAISAQTGAASGAFGLLSSGSDAVPVVAAFDNDRDMERWTAKCQRRGHHVRPIEGFQRIVEAKLPRSAAIAYQRLPSLTSLFNVTPAVIDKSDRRFQRDRTIAEVAGAKTISLEEIRRRLRTGSNNKSLQGQGTNGEGVSVAVIDTGAQLRPEYASRIVDKKSFVPDEPDATDRSDCRHGSNCAMIIAQLAPEVSLLIAKAFCAEGYAQLIWTLDAIAWAINRGAHVINTSWGSCHCHGANKCVLCRAMNGIQPVVCASAGNGGPKHKTLSCPGAAREAIAVASCDRDGRISDFSSRGPSADLTNPKPDITSFGERVSLRTTTKGPNETPMNGTSFSAPQVTAAVSCVMSAAQVAGRTVGKSEIKNTLRRTARRGELTRANRDANAAGAGLLSIADAVTSVLGTERHVLRATQFSFRRAFAAAAVALLLVALWWSLFDHSNELLVANDRPVRAVGWIRVDRQGKLFLDDGTTPIPLAWNDSDTIPSSGSLVFVTGRWNSQDRHVQGSRRVTLWPGNSPSANPEFH